MLAMTTSPTSCAPARPSTLSAITLRESSTGACRVTQEPVTPETKPQWLTVQRGSAPLVVTMPHTGTDLVPESEAGLESPWLARKDADWWIHRLYGFAADLGATVIRTTLSRTVIDANRDPSGVSLFPGQATTELCPTTTFDGELLYQPGQEPDAAEIERRKDRWFMPYHEAL